MKTDKNFIPYPLLGQHFIINDSFPKLMADNLPAGVTVIEIGPGMGQLTEVLCKKTEKVIAIEIDKRFQKLLTTLKGKYKNLEIVFGDALSGTLDEIIKKNKGKNIWIVSNLPYHITEPFINKVVRFPKIKMILTVGKKSGIQSQIKDPNNVNFSELSFVCNAFFDITKIADVPKEVFWPAPDTNSVILKFLPKIQTSINQKLILSQKYGGLIKNVLMKIFSKNMTKNEARSKVKSLSLPDEVLRKSFSQLNNSEVQMLAKSLDSTEPLLSS